MLDNFELHRNSKDYIGNGQNLAKDKEKGFRFLTDDRYQDLIELRHVYLVRSSP